MSIKTWTNEYYPVHADRSCTTDLMAIEHSLKKYEGLRSVNLKKHDVRLEDGQLCGSILKKGKIKEGVYVMSHDSCALCSKHYSAMFDVPCQTCPLYLSDNHCLRIGSPYRKARYRSQVGPIIKVLTTLKNQCNKRGKWIKPESK